MQVFLQQLINGLSIGAVYALIALGYTMVYGILRLINFAHGDVYMVGAVLAYYLSCWAQKHVHSTVAALAIVLAGAMIGCAVLGFLIEFLCYRPLRNRPRLVALITAIGVSLFLENLFQYDGIFGANPRQMAQLIVVKPIVSFHIGGSPTAVVISSVDAITLGLSLVLMLALSWLVLKTRTGLAMRAVSFRFDTAALMGINTNRIISITFVIGSALAAVAGCIDAMRYDINPLMGVRPGIVAFTAAVLGGIGSIPGAVLGGLMIGMVETLLKGLILPSAYSGFADAAAFVVLIFILLLKPSGLLGKKALEKV